MRDRGNAGKTGRIDMKTGDASVVRDSYTAVVGRESGGVEKGSHSDYLMQMPGTLDAVSEMCHAHGGRAVVPPCGLAAGRFCAIEDPGGPVAALYQPKAG